MIGKTNPYEDCQPIVNAFLEASSVWSPKIEKLFREDPTLGNRQDLYDALFDMGVLNNDVSLVSILLDCNVVNQTKKADFAVRAAQEMKEDKPEYDQMLKLLLSHPKISNVILASKLNDHPNCLSGIQLTKEVMSKQNWKTFVNDTMLSTLGISRYQDLNGIRYKNAIVIYPKNFATLDANSTTKYQELSKQCAKDIENCLSI